MNIGVTEMIVNMGFHPGTKEENCEELGADVRVAKALNVKEGSKVYFIERVRTANGRAVVYSVDMIPLWCIPTPMY